MMQNKIFRFPKNKQGQKLRTAAEEGALSFLVDSRHLFEAKIYWVYSMFDASQSIFSWARFDSLQIHNNI